MDELVISGKRFISSRSAAREHGYHSDYIGQLIRGGKVHGQKVGRAWYVDAESLETYLQKESGTAPSAPVAARTPEPTPPQEKVEVPEVKKEEINKEIKLEVHAPQPENFVEQETRVEIIPQKVAEPTQPIETIELEPEPADTVEAQEHAIPIMAVQDVPQRGLTYVADEPVHAHTHVMPRAPYEAEHVPAPRRWRAMHLGALVAVSVAIFVVSAYLSSALATTVAAGQGMTASSGYTLE